MRGQCKSISNQSTSQNLVFFKHHPFPKLFETFISDSFAITELIKHNISLGMELK